MSLFKLRGTLTSSQSVFLGLAGFVILVAIWWALAEYKAIEKPIFENFDVHLPSSLDTTQTINYDSLKLADSLAFANPIGYERVYPLVPRPDHTLLAYPSLYQEDQLLSNTGRSVWLNIQGYFWALIISIPIGFMIGLFPLFRGLFSYQIDAMRYLPLTALTGLFIVWFGIEDQMKIAFLAFGIIVYLLPVVVQRIDEVKAVYLKTVFTLGATDWQTIRTVYLPSVMSKLMDDIRVLTAISWTYIIIAELLNRAGGIGSLIYIKARQGQTEKVFAILIIIIVIGFFQDRIFMYMDKRIFPHKYYKKTLAGIKEIQYGVFTILGMITFSLIFNYAIIKTTILPIVIVSSLLIIFYGEFKLLQTRKNRE